MSAVFASAGFGSAGLLPAVAAAASGCAMSTTTLAPSRHDFTVAPSGISNRTMLPPSASVALSLLTPRGGKLGSRPRSTGTARLKRIVALLPRSEERRVGKEWRCGGVPAGYKEK